MDIILTGKRKISKHTQVITVIANNLKNSIYNNATDFGHLNAKMGQWFALTSDYTGGTNPISRETMSYNMLVDGEEEYSNNIFSTAKGVFTVFHNENTDQPKLMTFDSGSNFQSMADLKTNIEYIYNKLTGSALTNTNVIVTNVTLFVY